MARKNGQKSDQKRDQKREDGGENSGSVAPLPGGGQKGTAAENSPMRLFERRRHPRYLLSGEQFKEVKTRRIFAVYDLSMTGLSIKVDENFWEMGTTVQGVLNLHPESIDLTARLVGYYGDRAALRFEMMSTYARTALSRALSPQRLGKSMTLAKEKLVLADQWYHGVCNTDLLMRVDDKGTLTRAELFFSSFYWGCIHNEIQTGVCQSFGHDRRQKLWQSPAENGQDPVTVEALDLVLDPTVDASKVELAKSIIQASHVDEALKKQILRWMNGSFEE